MECGEFVSCFSRTRTSCHFTRSCSECNKIIWLFFTHTIITTTHSFLFPFLTFIPKLVSLISRVIFHCFFVKYWQLQGPIELVYYFVDECNKKMIEDLKKQQTNFDQYILFVFFNLFGLLLWHYHSLSVLFCFVVAVDLFF